MPQENETRLVKMSRPSFSFWSTPKRTKRLHLSHHFERVVAVVIGGIDRRPADDVTGIRVQPNFRGESPCLHELDELDGQTNQLGKLYELVAQFLELFEDALVGPLFPHSESGIRKESLPAATRGFQPQMPHVLG
jgi:hypothetical protein